MRGHPERPHCPARDREIRTESYGPGATEGADKCEQSGGAGTGAVHLRETGSMRGDRKGIKYRKREVLAKRVMRSVEGHLAPETAKS